LHPSWGEWGQRLGRALPPRRRAEGRLGEGRLPQACLGHFSKDPVNGEAASSKRINDGGRDKAERGKLAYSPDQQIRHAAVFPSLSATAPHKRVEQKGPVSKKNPAVASGAL